MTEPKYRFGPLERRGLIAGWRGGQIASVAGGVLLALASLRRPSVPGVVIAIASVGGALAFACWPVGGRTGEEWFPTLARWLAASGRRRHLAPAGDGQSPEISISQTGTRLRRTGPFTDLGIKVVTPDGTVAGSSDIGVLHDRRLGSYAAVLAVRGHSFALLGPEDKERRVATWAAVLASLSREHSSVHRVQWLASAVPDDGRGVRGHLAERRVLAAESPASQSYAALLDGAGADTCHHEVHLVVQVRSGGVFQFRPRRTIQRRPRPIAVLLREVADIQRLLNDADVTTDGMLGPRALAGLIRAASDPRPRGGGDRANEPGWPWPMAIEAQWDRLRTDDTWQATYWMAEWPRVNVGPDFLGPLLLGPVRRRVSVVMEPLSPTRATRAVEQARTADIADSELRRRGGFLSTARRARESELVERRESELADGHGSFRFSGYVTVTSATENGLDEACAATEQAAGQARLELRRLFGDQERAFTCTLPLARGLS